MTDLQTLYRFVLHLASCLLVVGLVFMISPVLASPCEPEKEEIAKAEDIINELRVDGTDVIDYSGCIVVGDLDFSDLPGEMDKNVTIIQRPLKFRKTVFKGRIDIKDQSPVSFSSKVDFVGASFEDHVNFDGAIFEEAAYFDGAIFEENAYFDDTHFHKMASFVDTIFLKNASFRSAQFDERALFWKTVFEGKTDFTVATFNWLAFFHKTEFCPPKSKHRAIFLFTRFNGLTYFTKARFNTTARFIGTHFRGPTYFAECTFDDKALFVSGCRFDDDVSFKGSNFSKNGSYDYGENIGEGPPVLFSGAVFSGNAIFSDVQFNNVSFCEIGMEVDKGMDTIFRKKADFRKATFKTLDLQRVIFESNVDFSEATFAKKADFSNVEFQSNVDFSGADFSKKVNFTDIDIERASITLKWDQLSEKDENERLLDSRWANFRYGDEKVPNFEWEGVILSRRRGNDKYLETDSQPCCDAFVRFLSSLERNFRKNGQHKDAEKVHFLAEDTKKTRIWDNDMGKMSNMCNMNRNMNRFEEILYNTRKYLTVDHIKKGVALPIEEKFFRAEEAIAKVANPIETCMSYISSCLDLLFSRYIYGYGVKYRRYVYASILAISGFALVYMRKGVLWHDEKKKGEIPRLLKINDLLRKWSDGKEVLVGSNRLIKRYMVGFWFSLSVFTKIGYRDLYVKDDYKKTGYAIKFEWFLGYILGALLFLNLISRCEPLSRLVTMFI